MREGVPYLKGNFLTLSFVCLLIGTIALFPFSSCHASLRQLRIGIIGDQTGTEDINKAYAALAEGAGILAGREVDLVFHIGDIVESKAPDIVMVEHFKRATGLLDGIGKPWYLTPGDHDVNPEVYEPASADRRKERLFRQLYSARNNKIGRHLYYSFDVTGYHLISLYSQETLHADPRWGNIFLARISDEQFAWLAQDLTDHRDSKGIVVFIHQPLWYNWSGWIKVHRLLKRFPVRAVVAGHYHYDQEEGRLDGIQYVVVGATGGSMKPANRDGGNVWHVTVMTIRATHADFELLALDGQTPLQLTPRVDMDRVQAIDTMLSPLGQFDRHNPLYLKGDTMVNSCGSQPPAQLKLAHIGNPIDVPVELDLQFSAQDIQLKSPQFSPDICRAGKAAMNCTIDPGSGIVLSNLSLVKSTFSRMAPKPIWTALPVMQVGNYPQPGTILNLKVRIGFRGQSGEFYVKKKIATTLKTCAP